MLETQTLALSLAQGINTKTDPKQVQGDYLLIQDAIYKTLEQLNPRLGYAALVRTVGFTNLPNVGGNITRGVALSSLNNSLLLHDGYYAYSYSSQEGTWATVGSKPAVTQSLLPIGARAAPRQYAPSVAKASNGVELYVWTGSSKNAETTVWGQKVYYSVYDSATQTILNEGSLQGTYVNAVALTVGTNFVILAGGCTSASNTTGRLVGFTASIVNPNFSLVGATTIASSLTVNDFNTSIDACTGFNTIYALYGRIFQIDPTTLAITNQTTTLNIAQPFAGIAYDFSLDNVWLANSTSGSDIFFSLYSHTLTLISGPTASGSSTIVSGSAICISSFGGVASCLVSTSVSYTASIIFANYNVTTPSAIAFVTQTMNMNAQAISRPFSIQDQFIYFFGAYLNSVDSGTWPTLPNATGMDPLEPTTFLLRIQPPPFATSPATIVPDVCAKSLALNTGVTYAMYSYSPSTLQALCVNPPYVVPDTINTSFILPNFQAVSTATTPVDVVNLQVVLLTRSSFKFIQKLRSQSVANNMHTSGGYITSYDQAIEVEHGFHLFPEIIQITQSGTVGWAPGTYSAVAVYAWTDAYGQTQRSSPSVPQQFIVASSAKAVQFEALPLNFTQKPSAVIEIYATLDAGTIYYLIDSYPATQTLSNQTSGPLVTTQLYTTGGEVDNISAPASSGFTAYKNRLFAIPYETPNILWYSKQAIPGVPVEFSDLFTLAVDAKGGGVTALAAMDDKLLIFKQRGIFFLVGDGPAPSGANNDFTAPQSIPTDAGCTEPDSVLVTPAGVFFKGSIGIYFIDRALNVSYIGSAVEAYNQFTITSAVLDPNTTQARFTLSNGQALVFDYLVKKWAVFSNISAVDACSWLGNYTYLTATGITNPETPGAYSDNGSVISMGFTTSWLSFAKIQGFERIKKFLLLGRCYSAAAASIGFAYDFNPAIVQTATMNMTSAENPWQRRVFPKRQKCETMQLTFLITPSNTSDIGLTLSSINLEVGIKKGFNKVSAAKSVGAS